MGAKRLLLVVVALSGCALAVGDPGRRWSEGYASFTAAGDTFSGSSERALCEQRRPEGGGACVPVRLRESDLPTDTWAIVGKTRPGAPWLYVGGSRAVCQRYWTAYVERMPDRAADLRCIPVELTR